MESKMAEEEQWSEIDTSKSSGKKEEVAFEIENEEPVEKLETVVEEQPEVKEKEIPAFTLDEILNRDKYKNTKIDFLDIDVEGADLKVLEGLSFDKFKPELVCVEIHAKEIKQSDIYKFMANKNYKLLSKLILSL
jgi:FkbM family methyltransferase